MLVTVGVSGVGVNVAVDVTVGVDVSVGSAIPPVAFSPKYMSAPPTTKKNKKSPKMIGKLSVTSGMRGAPIWGTLLEPPLVGVLPLLAGWLGADCSVRGLFSATVSLKVVPHTKQRGASSRTLVPQVGQTLVGFEGLSKLISSGHYTRI